MNMSAQSEPARTSAGKVVLAGLILCIGTTVFGTDIVVRPKTTEAHLRNPGMGFIYPAVQQPIPEIADVFYIWINTWTDVEPESGQFNWNLPNIVNVIEAARSTGRQAALRILPCFNEKSSPLPPWLKNSGVRLFQRDDGSNYEPEYWHPAYIEAYAKFVEACGKRFDGEPWLAWVDMRFYGFWGEGHRYGATVPWPEKVDKRALLIRVLEYGTCAPFERHPWRSRRPRIKTHPSRLAQRLIMPSSMVAGCGETDLGPSSRNRRPDSSNRTGDEASPLPRMAVRMRVFSISRSIASVRMPGPSRWTKCLNRCSNTTSITFPSAGARVIWMRS